jgi:hypothetical protein
MNESKSSTRNLTNKSSSEVSKRHPAQIILRKISLQAINLTVKLTEIVKLEQRKQHKKCLILFLKLVPRQTLN